MSKNNPAGERVAAAIEKLRAERGYSLRDLSVRLAEHGRPILPIGLSRQSQGARRIDVDDLIAFGAVLKASPVVLLGLAPCGTCNDAPHAGFTCRSCGRDGAAA